MSTKFSVAGGDSFHFYRECFDAENVYLQLDSADFEVEGRWGLTALTRVVFLQKCE